MKILFYIVCICFTLEESFKIDFGVDRCKDDMEKHLTQSVLSRLPYGYQSILKQSISSEEDDMGTLSLLYLSYQFPFMITWL